MRKLTSQQLERLRALAVASLELPRTNRMDFGMAPEDLFVACERALGWDDNSDEGDADERRALVETSHQRCAQAWRCKGTRLSESARSSVSRRDG